MKERERITTTKHRGRPKKATAGLTKATGIVKSEEEMESEADYE